MKQILALVFTLLLSANIGFAQKSKNKKLLIGSWQMSTPEGKKPSKHNNIILVFKKDATLEVSEKGSTKQSNWSLSDDGKFINITREEENRQIGIVSLDKTTMQLDKEGDVAKFERMEKKPAVKLKGLAKDLVGTWKVTGEEPGMLLKFNADGTANNSGEAETAIWKTSADGKQLILYVNDHEEAVDIVMAKDKKSFTLTANNVKLNLIRTNEKFTQKSKSEEPAIEEVMEKSNVKESEIIGSWKVIEIDQEILAERVLSIELKSDKTFKVTENGIEERSGKWEFRNGRVYLNDIQNNNTDYSVNKDSDGYLLLNDYYGIMKLKKQ